VAAEPITDIDTTAADILSDLDEDLNARGINLVFAELKDPVRAKIECYGLTRTIDPHHFYPTVGAAVTAFQAETVAQWTAAPGPVGTGKSHGRSSPAGDLPADQTGNDHGREDLRTPDRG
jgi:hypothetical protein